MQVSTTPQIYLYMRFSDLKQADGDSIRRQRDYAERVAKEKNLTINEDLVMTDRGISAFKSKNAKKGKLGAFIKAIDDGLVAERSILIVESLDRLSRDTPFTAHFQFSKLIDKGITIITANDKNEYNEQTLSKYPSQLFTLTGTMLRAHDESLHKQKRSIEKIKDKIKRFEEEGVVKPLGTVPHWLDPVKDGYKLNDNSKTIKLIIDMYLDNKGLNTISRELNDRNIKSPKGLNRWGVTTIRKILDNKALYGYKEFELSYLIDGREITEKHGLEHYYPSIISKNDYLVIQERKKKKANSRESYGDVTYLLSSYGKGKSVCAKCGHATGTQMQKQKNRKGEYTQRVMRLHCKKHRETLDCCKSFKCEELEQKFIHIIYSELDPNFITYKKNTINEEAIKAEISDINEQIKSLIKLRIDIKDSSTYKIIDEQIKELDAKKIGLVDLINQNVEDRKNKDQVKELRSLALKCLDINNNEERKQFKHLLMQAIEKMFINFEKKSINIVFYNKNEMSIYRDKLSGRYTSLLFHKKVRLKNKVPH